MIASSNIVTGATLPPVSVSGGMFVQYQAAIKRQKDNGRHMAARP
jgi:hypothetical protein